MKLTRLLPLLCFFCFATPAAGSSLRAVVSQVLDGQTILVSAGPNRSLTVVLVGVDAPELKQEFGDVAQKHLESLILNKGVEVEFAHVGTSTLVGKVYCNGVDVGLQIVRDGVAWYDESTNQDLSEVERRLYGEAQQLARSELRGFWRDGTPMPPWEWRRAARTRNANTLTATNAKPRVANPRRLSSEDLVLARPVGSVESGSNSKPSGPTAKLAPKPPSGPLNSPGEDFDFSSYLNNGRVSIVYFYADWCPSCRGLSPVLAKINRDVPDMQVLFLNIGDWDTPITNRYDITYVPYLRIYDKNGSLIAEGRQANAWLQQEFRPRS
jgi:endonuclease YncB( thermonuclease family)/thiol-disulfide isomerase/thioredoxin